MKVNYPETILVKSDCVTSSEQYLSRLCNDTFLSFWSFPNVYRDEGRKNGKGDGKEVCDILVIFGNHIIIFSDKKCEFISSGNIEVDWSRWYKKAVYDSAKQIYGAERWILDYPERIYLDKECTKKFPYNIPDRKQAIVHRIVVAHGASKECKKRFKASGSLKIDTNIIGDKHYNTFKHPQIEPFTIGIVDPTKGYVHVFDDFSLETVMKTLDTVSDFVSYLTKKEALFASGKRIIAAGEEEILAHYLANIDANQEHCFNIGNKKEVIFKKGLWEDFSKSPERKAQIEADKISYVWDDIIERFYYFYSQGASYYLTDTDVVRNEEVFRMLAKENRFRRRILANALRELMEKTAKNQRSTRLSIPPVSHEGPYYLFLLLPYYETVPYDEYREFRRKLLYKYLVIVKKRFPNAMDIIGFATESGIDVENRSEDFAYFDGRTWTKDDEINAIEEEKNLTDIGLLGEPTIAMRSYKEYPIEHKPLNRMKGSERNNPCPCGSGKKYKNCCGK